MQELKEFTCTVCGKDFKKGAYLGCSGNPSLAHVIEPVTFYNKLSDGYTKIVKADMPFHDQTSGTVTRLGGKTAHFMAGRHTTSDPEVANILSLDPSCCSREAFEDARIPQSVKVARQQTTIAEQKRLIDKLNADLAEAKKAKAETAEEVQASDEPEEAPKAVAKSARARK
jgi:hypothetical protein